MLYKADDKLVLYLSDKNVMSVYGHISLQFAVICLCIEEYVFIQPSPVIETDTSYIKINLSDYKLSMLIDVNK